jgi:hypothetical protein
VKIKTTSRQKIDEQFCWFVVPEIIIGVPKFDQGACIAYLIDKLLTNGFAVRYIHPNALFICWQQWVPSYVRSELKKKTGIVIDEFGKKVQDEEDANKLTLDFSSSSTLSNGQPATPTTKSKEKNANNNKYTPIKSYKPTGSLVYDEELLNLNL